MINVSSNFWFQSQSPRGARPEIPAANLPVEERFAYYQGLIESNEGVFQPGTPALLGLRGLAPDNERHDSAQNIGPYNDTLVLLHRQPDGTPLLKEFRGSTHAGQKSSSASPGGVAPLRPGNYLTIDHGDHNDMPSWHFVTTGGDDHVPAWRDANKDGYISSQEKRKAQQGGTTATSILLHNGVNEDHGRSIGCQTLPPRLMQDFIDTIGVHTPFKYTLVDANLPTPS